MKPLDLSHPAILGLFGDYKLKGRTESQAFLAWFLENYYRLDATDVDDTLCDHTGDKGIDGIYVDSLNEEILIFQSRLGTATPLGTIGDTALKELVGTLSQFKDGKSVRDLSKATKSNALRNLIALHEVEKLVGDGYKVRGVFVSNKKRDRNAQDFMNTNPPIELYDDIELRRRYLPIDKAEPIAKAATFDISRVEVLRHNIEKGVDLIVAPILASELVSMEGIANQELFAWNLRYQLKRSPVNKAINKSIETQAEHKYFPAFHNGLTILAAKIDEDRTKGKLTISGYAVVNGCQSLTALFNNTTRLTSKLRILTKFISISPKKPLALKITDHTNRQNGIIGRDLQSNNPLQTRLQSEIHRKYKGKVFYRIARGEHPEWNPERVIENDAAARVLLAFDLKQPESCHQNYKLFGSLHADIFGRPEVDAERLVAFMEIDGAIADALPGMNDKSFAGYTLTRFLFHYLLREALELPKSGGVNFWIDLGTITNVHNWRVCLRQALKPVIEALMKSVDAAYLKKHTEPDFDFRNDLKSPNKVKDIRNETINYYDMAIGSFTEPFSECWSKATRRRARAHS